MATPLSIIVACSENRVIGRAGKLPWRIAEDWEYFKAKTTGSTVIVGRIGFESWKSILEDGRHAIVITRDQSLARSGVRVALSLRTALDLARSEVRPVFICGGQRIFEEAIHLPDVQRLFLTLVHATIEGDRYFPEWRQAFPRVIHKRDSADENFRYTFYECARAGC